jgi:hypothetical protein
MNISVSLICPVVPPTVFGQDWPGVVCARKKDVGSENL